MNLTSAVKIAHNYFPHLTNDELGTMVKDYNKISPLSELELRREFGKIRHTFKTGDIALYGGPYVEEVILQKFISPAVVEVVVRDTENMVKLVVNISELTKKS
jgi:hypothetical protein